MVGIARAALCWSTNWARGGRDPNSHRPAVIWSLLSSSSSWSCNVAQSVENVVFHNPRHYIASLPKDSWAEIVGGKVKMFSSQFLFLGQSWQTKETNRETFFADGAAIKEGEVQYVAFLTFQILNFHAIFLFQSCISLYVNLSHLCGFVCPPLIFLYFVFLLPLEVWWGPRLVKWSLSPADYHNSNPFI